LPADAFAYDAFAYDAFVSYRQQEPDRTWVRRTLVPWLEAAGLRVCVDYRCFRLGAPFVTETERAVEHSRYTVAVLSQPTSPAASPSSRTSWPITEA
jgi:TIR domain